MASLNVLTFDAEGRAVDFEVWLDDLQLFLQCDSKDGLSLFDLTSGTSTAPAADADSTVRSQWLTRDAAARLAMRNHLPSTERAPFSQYKSARALYDAVVARYSSPTTATLSRLMLPYLFPDLAAFATVADLVAHLRTSDARYRAALPTEFLPTNSPPMDHFLSLCPTALTIDLLEERLAAAEKSILAVGASRGDRRTPFFEGCSPVPLLPSVAFAAAVNLLALRRSALRLPLVGDAALARAREARVEEGAVEEAVEEVEVVVGVVPGVGASVAAVEAVEAVAEALEAAAAVVEVAEEVALVALREWYAGRGRSRGASPCTYVLRTGTRSGEVCGLPHTTLRFFGRLTDAWRTQFPDAVDLPHWHDLLLQNVPIFDLDFDAILAAMYAHADITEGDCYLRVPPDPGSVAAALSASASAAPGACAAAALGASASAAPGAVLAHSSTVLPCPAAPLGLLSGLHLPLFSTNLVSGADLQYAWVDQFTPGGQRVTHCTCSRMGRHLATFTRRPGSSLYTLTNAPSPVSASGQVAASSQVFATASRSRPASAPCSCRPLAHETLFWHHRLGNPSLPRLRGMASRALVSGLPRSLPPLPPGPAPTCVPCVEGRQRAAPHSSSFPPTEAPLQTLHMDVWGPARVRGQGHERYFFLVVDDYSHYTTVFPLRSKGETEVGSFPLPVYEPSVVHRASARPSHFRPLHSKMGLLSATLAWSWMSLYAAHQINLQPRVSLPETTPTLRWMGKVGDASAFRDVTFDESVSYYRLFPYRTASPPPSPLFLAPDPAEPVEVAVASGAARGAYSTGAGPGGAETGGAESGGAEPGGVAPEGTASRGAEPACVEFGGALGVASRREPLSPQRLRGAAGATGAAGGGAGAGAARGAAGAGGGGAARGGAGAGAAGGGAAAGAAGGAAGTGDPGAEGTGSVSAVSGGVPRPRLYYVTLLQQVLGSPPSPGPPPPFLSPPPLQSQSQLQPASPLPGPSPYSSPTRGLTELREPESRPMSPESRSASPVHPVRAVCVLRPRLPPVPGTHSMTLHPSTAPKRVPLPSPPASSLPDGPDPESDSLRAASPTVTRFLATAVTDPLFESTAASALVTELVDFAAACRLDYAASLVAESASVCPLSVGGECALGTDVLEDRQEDLECFSATSPHLVSMLLALEGDLDALDIPTPRSYAEAIEGPYSSQWQAAMDAEMASWKSTGTYVDEVPPPGANIVSGMWIFRGVDFFQTFSPTPKMTTLRVLLHVAAQRDYELHSLDFSTAFLQGSLHEEIWLRRPPGFPGSFPSGTHWSLRRPVYGLRQAPREWHDTLRTTLAALDDLVFATADTEALAHVKSELQKRHNCTDLGELTSYLGLRITRDRAQCTITLTQSHMVQLVLQRFGFTYSSPQSTPLPTGHLLSAPPSDESVEPSGPCPELVGCLMYLMTCTRPDLAYPLSLLARYVAPGRHPKVHWDAAKRVLRYLCSTSGMGLVLGGRAQVGLTGHADASWVDDLATQRSSQGYTFSLGSGSVSWRSTRSSSVLSSSCEAEIYAGAMAA
ncbi:unnamed protein product [Closterium sp. NIES-53]